jgi:valyl-tRNA synthetase
MPFITEEIWHLLRERKEGEDIIVAHWPETAGFDNTLLDDFPVAAAIIGEVRTFRQSKNISPKDALELFYRNESGNNSIEKFSTLICKLANLTSIQKISEKPVDAFPFVVQQYECFIPIGENIDREAETERLLKELDYTKGFLKSVMAKLGNERFVNNAKQEVVLAEEKKKADAEARIKAIEEALSTLKV